jgi:ADP-ribose pyrophosphatase
MFSHSASGGGKQAGREYVEHPGAVMMIPLFDDGTTALVREYRYLLGGDYWEFPIGGMKAGETPLQVAQKELHEEAGLVAKTWIPIGRFSPYKGLSTEICHYFVAKDLSFDHQELEPSEQITVHRMPLAEARKLLVEQACGDGMSWCGLVMLDRYLAAESKRASD